MRGLLLALVMVTACARAERLPVLGQIDLPHPYYFREMYLPQLTSGPSGLAWSPDSRELVYSMAGSLWRQKLDSDVAVEVTAPMGEAYDYQPDWSPDGRFVVYSSYRGDAVELWLLDLRSGETHALTANGAVNVEPRFSPDGRRLVFVSTQFNRRFHLFTAELGADGRLDDPRRLTGETRSGLPRYYYSAYDHEINPVWSRDGREIIYVSNRGHIHGTGGFWRIAAPVAAAAGAGPAVTTPELPPGAEFHYEETNWRARPDLSPDGTRLVYASYLGRAWHNLWLMPAAGGDAFPLSYGDWDQTNPRWSPDGSRIAFISNQHGNTEIDLTHVPGGDVAALPIRERRHLRPMARLRLTLTDRAGQAADARISVTDAAGRAHAPDDAWIHGDDGFDRAERRAEVHYFHLHGTASLDVPPGSIDVDILHGLERSFERRRIAVAAGVETAVAVNVDDGRFSVPAEGRWVSADVHVHMNYGGLYRNTPTRLVTQARAEDLGLVNALIVNKEQRFPDMAYDGRQRDAASRPDAVVLHGQEFHTSYWGHLGLLGIGAVILPGYVGYPNTAAASLYPMNADVADIAHGRGALVGYVHPFDEYPEPLAHPDQRLTDELPVDVALGKVDYMEILGFSDHRATARVWYQLLNLGFHIPAAGGTDAMADFASLRGPVGMNRVYARVPVGDIDPSAWLESLKEGRTFATNGPLLGFTLGGVTMGDVLALQTGQFRVEFSAHLHSIVPVDHLEVVCNGRVVRDLPRPGLSADVRGTIALKQSGWCVLRASTDRARHPILDNYVYATTSPVYVRIGGKPPRSPADARYFAAWIDRIREATEVYPDWNDAAEKQGVLDRLAQARAVFAGLE